MESDLSSPTTEKQDPAPQSVRQTHNPAVQRSFHLLETLLRLRAFEVLRYREFRLIWFGQVFASMGRWMDQVARGWLIYRLTNSTLQLGLVQGMHAIPFLLLSPIAGSAADRYSRKFLLVGSQVVDGLLFASLALLIITGEIRSWHVYATAFAMAAVQTFQQPSRTAMIADTVPSSHLTNAIGLNAIVFNIARTAGPALAGLLIAMVGTAGSYSVQAVFYLMATIWTLQLPESSASSVDSRGHNTKTASLAQSIVEGWKFSWRNEPVRTALLIAMFASLFVVPFVTLLPVFARDILRVGATGQGLLLTAMGVGALFSSVLIASLGHRLPRGLVMLGGATLYALLVVLFAGSHWFEFSMVLMGILGLCHVTSHALVQTVIQTYSPSEFRGRATSLFHMNQVLQTVGSVAIGALSVPLGARWGVAVMSIAGGLAIVAIYVALPRARLIR